MLQQRNHDIGITRATLVTDEAVTTSGNTTDTYEARKVEGRCTYPGCRKDASEDCQLCPRHRREAQERVRRSQNATRQARRDAGMCPRCGIVKTDDYMCSRCRVKNSRVKRARRGGDNNRDNNAGVRVSRDEADGFLRRRYHGKMKRGAPSLDEQDGFERRIIAAGIERYLKTSEFLSSEDGKALPNAERESMRMAAFGQLDLAVRAGDEVLERNRYAQKAAKAAEHQKLRQLGKAAAEFAKSGR